jgi:glutathione synthase
VLAVPSGRGREGWVLGPPEDLAVSELDAVHYRVDPPVDRRYLEHLQLLAAACERGPELVNPWPVLFAMGDKLGPPGLARLMPPSIASSSWERLEGFGRAEGRTVLKPLGGAQSRGVALLDWTSAPGREVAREAVAAASEAFTRPVLLQRYLPEIQHGEKRLWFADGQLVAQVRKRPLPDGFLVDMDKGSACEPCTLAPAEARLAEAVGAALVRERVRLAAIDVIAAQVTDWNLTSPGLLPLMEDVLERNLARPVLQALTRRRALQAAPAA